MRVAIYARVSTADQNCDRQLRELRAFAQRLGAEVVGTFKETASGVNNDRAERKKVLGLAQAREIDAVLVSELSRWGRSLLDLIETLQALQSWRVSLLAASGLQLDLGTPHGKLLAGVLASLAEFERDLLRERVKSGLAAAKARGKVLGRKKGFRPTAKHDRRIQELAAVGRSYRQIARELGIDKGTVMTVVKRGRAAA
jgi:DNA invertase Pin-like site-specific DNA recombinase